MVIQIVSKWEIEPVINDMCIEMLYVLSCKLWTVQSYNLRPFKRDEYCDGIHCGNPTSWIILRRD